MIQHMCDICGSVINPPNSSRFLLFKCDKERRAIGTVEYELCCSCMLKLKQWINHEAEIVIKESIP